MQKTIKEICLFLIIAFVLPLISVYLMQNIVFFKSGTPNFIIYGIEAAAPALAALITTFILTKSKGLKEFLIQKYLNNISTKNIVIAFSLPLIILMVAKLTTLLFSFDESLFSPVTSKKIIVIFYALIAEELGWRGFLQERIKSLTNSFLTPLIVGIIWSLWHYHYFLSGSMNVPIVPFLFGCIAESYGYFALTEKSCGNIIPASVMHFSGNLFLNLFVLNNISTQNGFKSYCVATAFDVVYIVYYVFYLKTSKGTKKYENRQLKIGG